MADLTAADVKRTLKEELRYHFICVNDVQALEKNNGWRVQLKRHDTGKLFSVEVPFPDSELPEKYVPRPIDLFKDQLDKVLEAHPPRPFSTS
jgi:hypothetical protein